MLPKVNKTVRLSFGPGAGVLLAIVLGAAPAAFLGLDLAWIVVAVGTTILSLAPWLARAQVLAIEGVELPRARTVHAGKTVEVPARLRLSRPGRMLLVALVRPGDHRVTRDRAPRVLVAAGGPSRGRASGAAAALAGAGVNLLLPLRVPTRGRSDALLFLIRSSYPFGLVSATRSLHVDLQLTALPRLSQERDVGLKRLMAHLAGSSDEANQRPVIRGEGLPAGLRDARTGDSRRDLHMRSSLRRGRWTAMERPELGQGLAEVTLHLPPTEGHPSRRSLAAFEAVTSTAAAVIQGLHRLGLEVDLGTLFQSPNAAGHLRPQRRGLLRSRNTLAHLHRLTDLSITPEGGARPGSRDARGALPTGGRAGSSFVGSSFAGSSFVGAAIVVELIPILSSSEHGDGPGGTHRQGVDSNSGPSHITLCVDANGRVSQRGAVL